MTSKHRLQINVIQMWTHYRPTDIPKLILPRIFLYQNVKLFKLDFSRCILTKTYHTRPLLTTQKLQLACLCIEFV